MLLDFEKQAKEIIELSSNERQLDMVIEEMSELTKAILKDRRYGTKTTRHNVYEELGDVYNMLKQLEIIYEFKWDELARTRYKKNCRTIKRLTDEL